MAQIKKRLIRSSNLETQKEVYLNAEEGSESGGGGVETEKVGSREVRGRFQKKREEGNREEGHERRASIQKRYGLDLEKEKSHVRGEGRTGTPLQGKEEGEKRIHGLKKPKQTDEGVCEKKKGCGHGRNVPWTLVSSIKK